MAILEIDLNPEKLAEAGYTAFGKASKNLQHMMPEPESFMPWDKASAGMRNFWREWARQFTIAHMTKGA